MLKQKLTQPVDDMVAWLDGLLDSQFGAITIDYIRTDIIALRDEVNKLFELIDPIVTAASIPRTWPGINLTHHYERTLRNAMNSYTTRFVQDYTHGLNDMHLRVMGHINTAANQGCAYALRLKSYLRFAPLRHAPDQKPIHIATLLADLQTDTTWASTSPAQHITANREHLIWVLTELTQNAAQFTENGARITTMSDADTVNITVRDDGPGLIGDVQPRLFEPFYQFDGNTPGLGIGLPLARHLTQINGGALTLESNPDDGTTITLTFPTH